MRSDKGGGLAPPPEPLERPRVQENLRVYTLQRNHLRDKGGAKIPEEPHGSPSPGSRPPDRKAHAPDGPLDDPDQGHRPSDEAERAQVVGTALLVLTPFLLFLVVLLLDRMIG